MVCGFGYQSLIKSTNAAHDRGDFAKDLAVIAIDWLECGVGW